jgi:hypothetical protein
MVGRPCNIAAALLTLCVVATAHAGDARPSIPYNGTATMQADGTIELALKQTADGKPAEGVLIYKVGDNAYDDIRRHLPGLRPGRTQRFSAWKD